MTPTRDRSNRLVINSQNIPEKEFKVAGFFSCEEKSHTRSSFKYTKSIN